MYRNEMDNPQQTTERKFNKVHSSLRCMIERSFQVWKARWAYLKNIPPHIKFENQVKLVCATMAIHNFIRRSNMADMAFQYYDRNHYFNPVDDEVGPSHDRHHEDQVQRDDAYMHRRRNELLDAVVRNGRY
ncbi:hypothetical protein Acr_20g0010860 [Actinidia rufa]|uniref:DDE Tnp4 domain-containing protein n=1 Tax=Actinidia rufa TaxID=165716 RepID=A0A7J0GEY6_9ERIC|nr:hypothetical protein Acr_20g0010860 [Actinidia rufa]